MLLADRRILVGVCGGIAAYKACELVRMFIREGAAVQAVLTPNAARFVAPLTFAALTGRSAPAEEFAEEAEGEEGIYAHLALSRDIDCLVIAPATANTLAKLAAGLADNLLTGAYLSCVAPVVIATAMNVRMWQHPAVQDSVATLRARGHWIVAPGTGELACGDIGGGRLAELVDIFAAVVQSIDGGSADEGLQDSAARTTEEQVPAGSLAGKRIIVTAGGTREYLDPVRFLTNASTGQLGLCIVAELTRHGATVELVDAGLNVDIAMESRLADRAIVRTAYDMQAEVTRRMASADALVMLAAVADYGPSSYSSTKRKKDGMPWVVELTETPDILAGVAEGRKPGQVLVGVSLEDQDWLERGMKKAAAKHVDLNIAVELGADLPFGDNRVHCALVTAEQVVAPAAQRAKSEVARLVADWLVTRFAGSSAVAAAD